MITTNDAFESHIKSLSPEILLKIFLNLESHETVILRSVCKEFVEIIDNNKSLWRILGWEQWEEESPVPALEMFDEKSASTLREVSIFQQTGHPDNRILKVIDRSKNSLVNLSLNLYIYEAAFRRKIIEIASNCHHLESLVLWHSQEYRISLFPKTRLSRSSRQSCLGTGQSSNLQVLWCFNLVREWNGNLDVSSLVSFADTTHYGSLQLHSFLIKFSTTLTHLFIDSDNGTTTPSLFCPSLRILEGRFSYGFPSWIDAPNLQIVIARDIGPNSLRQLPISVEELWLLNWYTWLTTERHLGVLSSVCPQLKIVKLGKELFEGDFDIGSVLESLRAREEKVGRGVEIGGIQVRSLEKLIVPTDLFALSELDDLREIVGEVIDIKEYPDLIELEY